MTRFKRGDSVIVPEYGVDRINYVHGVVVGPHARFENTTWVQVWPHSTPKYYGNDELTPFDLADCPGTQAQTPERPDCEEWEWWMHAVTCTCDYCREAGHGNLVQESEGGWGE